VGGAAVRILLKKSHRIMSIRTENHGMMVGNLSISIIVDGNVKFCA